MADFLNIQQPVNVPTERTEAVSSNFYNTSEYAPGEIGLLSDIDPLTLENLQRALVKPKQRMPIADLHRQDIFPTPTGPVTQSGFTGFGMSIPTIAPTAALFPFAAFEKRMLAEEGDFKKAADDLAWSPEFTELVDATRNDDFMEARLDVYKQFYDEAVKKSTEQFGTARGAGAILKNDKNYNKIHRAYEYAAKAYNQVFPMVQEVIAARTDPSIWVPKSAQKGTSDLLNLLDDHLVNPGPDTIDKIGNIMRNLQKDKAVSGVIKNLKDTFVADTYTLPEELRKTLDYHEQVDYVITGKFFRFDKDENGNKIGGPLLDEKGAPVFNEEAFDEYAETAYNTNYLGDEFAPPKDDFKKMLRQMVEHSYKISRKAYSVYNASSRVWEDEQKNKFDFDATTKTDYMANQMGVKSAVALTNVYSIPDKDKKGRKIQYNIEGLKVYDRDTGEWIIIPGSVIFDPDEVGSVPVAENLSNPNDYEYYTEQNKVTWDMTTQQGTTRIKNRKQAIGRLSLPGDKQSISVKIPQYAKNKDGSYKRDKKGKKIQVGTVTATKSKDEIGKMSVNIDYDQVGNKIEQSVVGFSDDTQNVDFDNVIYSTEQGIRQPSFQ